MKEEPKNRSTDSLTRSKGSSRARHLMIAIAALHLISACDDRLEEPDRNRIARAYAGVLFYQAKYPTDTLRQRAAIDSTLRRNDFESLAELKSAVSKASEQPDDFRMMLDSTQRYIEAHQKAAPSGGR